MDAALLTDVLPTLAVDTCDDDPLVDDPVVDTLLRAGGGTVEVAGAADAAALASSAAGSGVGVYSQPNNESNERFSNIRSTICLMGILAVGAPVALAVLGAELEPSDGRGAPLAGTAPRGGAWNGVVDIHLKEYTDMHRHSGV